MVGTVGCSGEAGGPDNRVAPIGCAASAGCTASSHEVLAMAPLQSVQPLAAFPNAAHPSTSACLAGMVNNGESVLLCGSLPPFGIGPSPLFGGTCQAHGNLQGPFNFSTCDPASGLLSAFSEALPSSSCPNSAALTSIRCAAGPTPGLPSAQGLQIMQMHTQPGNTNTNSTTPKAAAATLWSDPSQPVPSFGDFMHDFRREVHAAKEQDARVSRFVPATASVLKVQNEIQARANQLFGCRGFVSTIDSSPLLVHGIAEPNDDFDFWPDELVPLGLAQDDMAMATTSTTASADEGDGSTSTTEGASISSISGSGEDVGDLWPIEMLVG